MLAFLAYEGYFPRVIAFGNFLVLAIGAAVFAAVRASLETPSGRVLAVAWLAFVAAHQLWHRRRYGCWFDGPLIREGVTPKIEPDEGRNRSRVGRGA